MFKKLLTPRALCLSAIIAALYAALTLLLAPISFGPLQCRISEAMTLLPVLMPQAIPGLFVGCLIANLFTGVITDVVFGSLATLLAAMGTWFLQDKPLLAALSPVVCNGVIVGTVLSLTQNLPLVPVMITVAIGEAAAVALGWLLVIALRRAKIDFTRLC